MLLPPAQKLKCLRRNEDAYSYKRWYQNNVYEKIEVYHF